MGRCRKSIRYLGHELVCLLVLVSFLFVACNVDFKPSFKESITDASLRSHVSRVIDAQIDNVKDCLDQELQDGIDNLGGGSRGLSRGSEIVDLTLGEKGGRDYLDFCYAVDYSRTTMDSDAVMETARSILPKDEYQNLLERAGEVERSITEKGNEIARSIPLSQQASFYRDLKILVTRAIVLLVAGIVYACIPDLVFWGKVSAACAISVGAGFVALSILSLYEYFRFGTGEEKTFEQWFKELLEVPKADFALTATVTTITEAMEIDPVVTGIIICIFGLYNVASLLRTMLKTYNFSA